MDAIPLILGITAGLFAAIVGLSWVVLFFMPRWTRPDIYFSVTVQPAFRQTPEAKQIEQRYRKQVTVHSVIGISLVLGSLLVLNIPAVSAGLLWCGLLLQPIGAMAAVVSARKRVRVHAVPSSPSREATIQPRPSHPAGGWWWLGPPLVLAAFAVYLSLQWDDIPARFPTHWGPSGLPDAWAARSIGSVFMLPILGTTCWIMLLGIAWALGRFSRRIHASGPGARGESTLLHIAQWVMLGAAYLIALTMGTSSLLPLLVEMNSPLPMWFYGIMGSELVLAVVSVLILARIGQGGWRLTGQSVDTALARDQRPTGDRTPDSAWKLGLFYYNPNDPALFVEKRFGIGWDFNWGRPAAWITLLALIIVPLLVVLLVSCWAIGTTQKEPAVTATTQAAIRRDRGPFIVETYPAHGAEDIDPALREIRIRFDQPMDQTACSIRPGGGHFPEVTGEPRWTDERTCVIPVRVRPSRMYEVMINMDGHRKFRSQTGRIAPSSVIDFSTAATSRVTDR